MKEYFKNFKNKTILKKYIISYVSVILLPICIGVLLQSASKNVVTKEIIEKNKIVIKQTEKVFSEIFNMYQLLNQQLHIDNNLEMLENMNESITKYDRNNLYQVNKNLKTSINNKYFEAIYIYFRNTQMILSHEAYYTEIIAYSKYHTSYEATQNEWYDFLRNVDERSYLVSQKDNERKIIFVEPYRRTLFSPTFATIVTIMNANYLDSVVDKGLNLNKISTCIIDENNNKLIFNDDNMLFNGIKYEQFSELKNQDIIKIDGKKMNILYNELGSTRLIHCSIIPVAYTNDKLSMVSLLIYVYIAISLVFGGALALYLAKRNYSPINDILSIIKSDNTEPKNELLVIEKSIKGLLKMNDNLNSIIYRQEKYFKNEIIKGLLLSGNTYGEVLSDLYKTFDIQFNMKNFKLILINNESEISSTYIDSIDLNEYLGKKYLYYFTSINNINIIILNYNEHINDDEIYKKIKIIYDDLYSNKNDVLIYIGKTYSDINDLHIAYNEALDIFTYNKSENIHGIVRTSNRNELFDKYILAKEQIDMLTNNIIYGNTTNVIKIFDSICNSNIRKENNSLQLIRCLFFEILSILIRAIRNKDIKDIEIFSYLDKQILLLHNKDDIKKMTNQCRNTIIKACNYINDYEILGKEELLDKIFKCVEKNYCNANFNVSMIANMLNMNLSYISKYFIDNTGIRLYDFINIKRIDLAKELLMQKKAISGKILKKVGFDNSHTFIRVFKKYEGTTPSKYKKNH